MAGKLFGARDRQGIVLIRLRTQSFGHESVPRHTVHSTEDAFVFNPVMAAKVLDHSQSGNFKTVRKICS